MALFMHFTNLVVIELADLEGRELFILQWLLAVKMRSMYLWGEQKRNEKLITPLAFPPGSMNIGSFVLNSTFPWSFYPFELSSYSSPFLIIKPLERCFCTCCFLPFLTRHTSSDPSPSPPVSWSCFLTGLYCWTQCLALGLPFHLVCHPSFSTFSLPLASRPRCPHASSCLSDLIVSDLSSYYLLMLPQILSSSLLLWLHLLSLHILCHFHD